MHHRHLFWRQMWPRYTSVRYVLSFLMLESICMWFTVALPFFRRQATFYSVCTRWVEGGENSKKKTTNIMRYSQKTAADSACVADTSIHACRGTCEYFSQFGRSISLRFHFFSLCRSRKIDTYWRRTPGSHVHTSFRELFYLWGFSSCEIPSSPYLYWKYHHRSGWRWHLSHHLKVCVWDQGCAGAICHNAPAHRRKCSSHCHHNIHTYTQTNTKCTLATCTCSACLVTLILVCNCVACHHSTVAVMRKVSQVFLFNCVFILK